MTDSIDTLIDRIQAKHLRDAPQTKVTLSEKIKQKIRSLLQYFLAHKKVVFVVLALVTVAFFVLVFLLEDYLTKRQAFPIRHVLYQCNETVKFARANRLGQNRLWDRDARTIIQKGNGDGTKLGEILGIHKLETTDEGGQYQLEDKDKTRIAYAVTKLEPVQAGISLRGALDFRETYAEILGDDERFINYKIIPERGSENIELNVLADAGGNKRLVNKLTTYRSRPLGVLWGIRFRAGTALDEFIPTAKNKENQQKFFRLVDKYQGSSGLSVAQREKLVENMLQVIYSMQTANTYISHEDGIIDYLPQESSTYLFYRPGFTQRLTASLYGEDAGNFPDTAVNIQKPFSVNNDGNEIVHLRVERGVDLWPGNIVILNKLAIGEEPNVVRPFAHTNNGGYEIVDGYGIVAKIEIEDFFLHYGDDVLYKYYLDKNGDGRIDKATEHIGQVLYRTHNDERSGKQKQDESAESEAEFTQRYSYSFMAGSDWDNRIDDFYLCNTIESFIVNEVNRGFGTFSDLGWINNQRSNIRLLENRNMSNLARAMSAESALVAKQDVVALLRAAKRGYVNKFIKQ